MNTRTTTRGPPSGEDWMEVHRTPPAGLNTRLSRGDQPMQSYFSPSTPSRGSLTGRQALIVRHVGHILQSDPWAFPRTASVPHLRLVDATTRPSCATFPCQGHYELSHLNASLLSLPCSQKSRPRERPFHPWAKLCAAFERRLWQTSKHTHTPRVITILQRTKTLVLPHHAAGSVAHGEATRLQPDHRRDITNVPGDGRGIDK
jgi:hypothetical protein